MAAPIRAASSGASCATSSRRSRSGGSRIAKRCSFSASPGWKAPSLARSARSSDAQASTRGAPGASAPAARSRSNQCACSAAEKRPISSRKKAAPAGIRGAGAAAPARTVTSGASPLPPQPVDGARDLIAPGARLAAHEHRHAQPRERPDPLAHAPHRRAAPGDQLREPVFVGLRRRGAGQLAGARDHALEIVGKREELLGASLDHLDGGRDVGVRRQQDHRHARDAADAPQQLDPVRARHAQVAHHQVGRFGAEAVPGFDPVARLDHREAGLGEVARDQRARLRAIVHQQHLGFAGHRLLRLRTAFGAC